MTSPFAQALLAIEIAVDALHDMAKQSPESRPIADDALAQIAYLGFDERKTEDRKPQTLITAKTAQRTHPNRRQRIQQKTLF